MTQEKRFGEIGRAVCDTKRLKGEAELVRSRLKAHHELLDQVSTQLGFLVRNSNPVGNFPYTMAALEAAETITETIALVERYQSIVQEIAGLELKINRA